MKRLFFIIVLLLTAATFTAQVQKVKDLENRRKALLSDIELTNSLLNENKKVASNALRRLNLLIQQIDSRKEVVEILNKEIVLLNGEIVEKEKQIKELEEKLQAKKANYTAAVRKMYVYNKTANRFMFIFSANSFAQSYRRVMYLKKYSEWQKEQAQAIAKEQAHLTEEKRQLEKSIAEKRLLLAEKKREEQQLQREEQSKSAEFESLKKDQKQLQTALANKRNEAEALNRQIDKIIADEVRAAQKAAEAQPQIERKAETTGGYAMTKEEKSLSSDFAKNKGRLPFPLKGKYKITEYFGVNRDRVLSNIQLNSGGIIVETTAGNNAKNVFEGVVAHVRVLPVYHLCVIVRHGNYLTIYANLGSVFVKAGDKVTTGQSLGVIHTNSDTNSTWLYFELRKESTKLNPLEWISR